MPAPWFLSLKPSHVQSWLGGMPEAEVAVHVAPKSELMIRSWSSAPGTAHVRPTTASTPTPMCEYGVTFLVSVHDRPPSDVR